MPEDRRDQRIAEAGKGLRRLVMAFALALVGVVGWMLTSAAPRPASLGEASIARVDSAASAGSSAIGVPTPAISGATSDRSKEIPVREEAVGRPPQYGMRCRVVYAGTGDPVPRAEVFVAAGRWREGLVADYAFWTRPEAHGWRFDADEEGWVRLPAIGGWRRVMARSGGWSGATRLYLLKGSEEEPGPQAPDGAAILLPIARGEALRVIVEVDGAGGVPGGIDVALSVDEQVLLLGPPDANGSVEIPQIHEIRTLSDRPSWSRLPTGGRMVHAHGSMATPVSRLQLRRGSRVVWQAPIESTDLRGGDYVLRVPRITDLHLQVVAPDGTELPKRTRFRVGGEGWSEVLESRDGACVLPSFVAGDRVWATAVPDDRSFAPTTEKEITIAAGADGVCRAILHYHQPGTRQEVSPDQEPMFRVRLLDGAGTPIGPTTLTWALDPRTEPLDVPADDESWVDPIRCNDDGIAWVPIRRDLLREVAWKERFYIPDAESPTATVTLRYYGMVLPGVTDLGDVMVESWQEVVAGNVVDPGGNPIAGAMVELLDPWGSSHEWWNSPADLDSTVGLTDASGGFSLRRLGALAQPGIRVRASLPDPERTESVRGNYGTVATRTGCTDVQIVLHAAITLRGSLVLPDGVRGEQFRVRARPNWPGELVEVAADGTFTLTTDSDPVTVIVGLKSETDNLLVLRGVAPEDADAQGWHPAITNIELGSALRTARVRLADAEDAPVARYPIVVRGRMKALIKTDDAGEVVIALGADPARIELGQIARGSRRVVSVDRDLQLTVEPLAPPDATEIDR